MLSFRFADPLPSGQVQREHDRLKPVTDFLESKGWRKTEIDPETNYYRDVYVEYRRIRSKARMFLIVDTYNRTHNHMTIALDGWDGHRRCHLYSKDGWDWNRPENIERAIKVAKALPQEPYPHFRSTSEPGIFRRGSTGPKIKVKIK